MSSFIEKEAKRGIYTFSIHDYSLTFSLAEGTEKLTINLRCIAKQELEWWPSLSEFSVRIKSPFTGRDKTEDDETIIGVVYSDVGDPGIHLVASTEFLQAILTSLSVIKSNSDYSGTISFETKSKLCEAGSERAVPILDASVCICA